MRRDAGDYLVDYAGQSINNISGNFPFTTSISVLNDKSYALPGKPNCKFFSNGPIQRKRSSLKKLPISPVAISRRSILSA
jgi:hypothetical protein